MIHLDSIKLKNNLKTVNQVRSTTFLNNLDDERGSSHMARGDKAIRSGTVVTNSEIGSLKDAPPAFDENEEDESNPRANNKAKKNEDSD